MTKRFGFTLAEVLITLTIIGVIAAMTIPTLLSNTSDQEYKTGIKKAISTINQAITMQYALDGTNMSDFTQSTDANLFTKDKKSVIYDVFQERMQVISTTSARTAAKSAGQKGNAAIYLSDGMVIEFPTKNDWKFDGTGCIGKGKNEKYDASSNPTGCLYTIVVDVNGDKGVCGTTNTTVGGKVRPKDCFPLNVYADGVRPGDYITEAIMYEGK